MFVDRTGLKILLYICGKLRISVMFVIQVGIIGSEYVKVPSIGNIFGNGNLGPETIELLCLSDYSVAKNQKHDKYEYFHQSPTCYSEAIQH